MSSTATSAKEELTKNDWSQKEIDERLTAAYGDKKEEVVTEFKKVQPQKKVQDALYLDNIFRPGGEDGARKKAGEEQSARLQLYFRF